MTCPNGEQTLHHVLPATIFHTNFAHKQWNKNKVNRLSWNIARVGWSFANVLFLEFLYCSFSCRSTQIKTYSWDNAQVVLAGNKCDMEEERVVSVDSGRLLAEQLGKSWSNIHPFVLFELGAVCHFPALCFCIEAVCKVQLQQQQLAKLFWKNI